MKRCGCQKNPFPRFHGGEYQDLWNRMFDALPKVTQDQLLKKGAHNRKIVSLFNAKVSREWEKRMLRPNPGKKRRRFTFVKGGGLLDRKTGKIRYFRRKKKNPLRVRRLPSGKYRVGSGRRVHAKATTRLRALRQASLIRGIKHGWRPTGRPAIGIRRKLKRIKSRNSRAYAVRSRATRRWTIRSGARGGIVFARGLNEAQLRAWARQHKYKTRSV
jgi:hypothetical protein